TAPVTAQLRTGGRVDSLVSMDASSSAPRREPAPPLTLSGPRGPRLSAGRVGAGGLPGARRAGARWAPVLGGRALGHRAGGTGSDLRMPRDSDGASASARVRASARDDVWKAGKR